MKNQNVSNKLAFNKAAVIELNDTQSVEINGGSTTICYIIIGYLLAQ